MKSTNEKIVQKIYRIKNTIDLCVAHEHEKNCSNVVSLVNGWMLTLKNFYGWTICVINRKKVQEFMLIGLYLYTNLAVNRIHTQLN